MFGKRCCFILTCCSGISRKVFKYQISHMLYNTKDRHAERELNFRILASISWRFVVSHLECTILQFWLVWQSGELG
jgi:hypothetical protein